MTHLLLLLAMMCPDSMTTTNYDTFVYCGGENEPFSTMTPCGIQYSYMSVAFTAGEGNTQISMTSEMNYNFAPFTAWNYAHLFIFDGCNGMPVYSTTTGSCSVGADLLVSGQVPAQNYDIELALPQGEYVLIFGYIGLVTGGGQNQFGCAELTIGSPSFLDLEHEGHGAGRDHWGNVKGKRFRKVVIEGRGLFIEDTENGELYDVMMRKVE